MRSEARRRERRRPWLLAGSIARVLTPRRRAVDGRHDLDPCAPASVRLDRRPENDAVRRQLRVGAVRADPRLARIVAALVTEHELLRVDTSERLARSVDRRVLDLEQIR